MLSGICGWAQVMQQDSVTHLGEVVIEGRRIDDFNIGHYTWRPDSSVNQLAAFGSLADLTRKFGFGHLRAYGPSGLATPSLRGTGASHTNVLWNGISLQSSLNGNVDMSLLPAMFVDDVEMQSGGSASIYGSGSIGGNIHLNNKVRFNDGITLSGSTAVGAFGHAFKGARISWSGKKVMSSARLFHVFAKNDFEYLNNSVTPAAVSRRDNSAVRQYGLLQENAWQINGRHLTTLRFWVQDNDVQVPNPSTVLRPSATNQKDQSIRSVFSWQYGGDKSHWLLQSVFAHYLTDYNDPVSSIRSTGTFDNLVNFMEGTFELSELWSVTSGINHTWERGKIEEYGASSPKRRRTAVYAALRYKTTRITSVLSAREELVDAQLIAPAVSTSLEYQFRHWIVLVGNSSASYRIPTFNDLYWTGAGAFGNRDLKVERSWSHEAGVRLQGIMLHNMMLTNTTSLFSNHVDNWIQWTPVLQTWTPVNLKKVWSRGLESATGLQHKLRSWHHHLEVLYTFSRTTNTEVYATANQAELDKQLFFTPAHEASLRTTWTSRRWTLMATLAFTGRQFTDAGNTPYLAMQPYHVLNSWAGFRHVLGNVDGQLFLEVNNLLDTSWETRPGYPMPGRNFKCGVNIKFNQPLKQ